MKMYSTRFQAKVAFILLAILAFYTPSKAQTFCPPCLTNFRTYNNTTITTKTGPKSITPINVGGNIDSLARYIADLSTSSGAAPTLQSVLNNGNIAAASAGNAIFGLYNTATSPTKQLNIDFNGCEVIQSGATIMDWGNNAGVPEMHVGNTGGGHTLITLNATTPEVSLKNAGTTSILLSGSTNGTMSLRDGTSSYYLNITGVPFSGSLSATRTLYAPNQSGTILVESSVNRPSSVTNSTFGNKIENAGWYLNGTYTSGPHTGNTFFSLVEAVTGGKLALYDNTTNFAVTTNAPSTLTASRDFDYPNHSGTLATNNGGSVTGGTVTSDSIVVTHGLGFTPSRIFYTARNVDAAQPYYITNITSTTFTIKYVPASVNPINFDWQAF